MASPASRTVITTSQTPQADNSFRVNGLYWLVANNPIANPTFISAYKSVSSADLTLLRAGTIVEAPFSTQFATGTSQATVDSTIAANYSAANTAFQAGQPTPPLATAVPRILAADGSTWSADVATPLAQLPFFGAPTAVIDSRITAALGLSPPIAADRRWGQAAATTTAQTVLRNSTYTAPTPGSVTGAQRSFVSSSASDTAAGTGAHAALLTYLTTAFAQKTEVITLNGTTAVNTTNTDIAYVESILVAGVGSGLANAGTITMSLGTGGTGGTFAVINAGENQTLWAHHYVPAAVNCLILGFFAGSSLQSGSASLVYHGNPSANFAVRPVGGQHPFQAASSADVIGQAPSVIVGPAFVELAVTPFAATASNVGFGMFEFLNV